MAKKIDTKKIAKDEILSVLAVAFADNEYEVVSGEEYGFKSHSLVIKGVNGHDVRVDLSAPKAGQDTYQYVLDKMAEDAQ